MQRMDGSEKSSGRGPGRAVLPLLWALCLLQLLTSAPNRPYTLLVPWTPEWWTVLGAFLATTPGLLRPRARGLYAAHLCLVALLFLLHPLSSVFGRDGALAAIGLYGLAVLARRTGTRPEWTLLAASLLVGVFLLEAGLNLWPETGRPAPGLLDYGDLMGDCGAGGCLKPGLDARILAERGAGRFVTNRLGFRADAEADDRAPGERRVLLLGDSFVAGYRMDQPDAIGARLERELRASGTGPVQVLAAELPHPEAARKYLAEHAARFACDLAVVGLTLGNDPAQAWAVRRRVPEPVIASVLLPDDAFERSAARRLGTKLERTLRSWRAWRRLARLLRAPAIVADYPDAPEHVHVFDSMHGLGLFYSRRPLPLLEQCFAELDAVLVELARAAAGARVPLLVAVFPQRFQANAAEWDATAREYGLDPGAFDLEQPNRRIAAACARAGLDCVDLLPAFREAPGATYLPLGDMHWSASGHALAARALAPAVAARLGPASGAAGGPPPEAERPRTSPLSSR